MDVTEALTGAIEMLKAIRTGARYSRREYVERMLAYEAALEAERARRDADERNRAQLRSLATMRRALKESFGG
jgi:hypothetical protein